MKVVEKHKELTGLRLGCIKEGNYSRGACQESSMDWTWVSKVNVAKATRGARRG
jgi:hypothetical protein